MVDWHPKRVKADKRVEIIGVVSGCWHFTVGEDGGKHECGATRRGQCPAIKFPQLAEEVEARWGERSEELLNYDYAS